MTSPDPIQSIKSTFLATLARIGELMLSMEAAAEELKALKQKKSDLEAQYQQVVANLPKEDEKPHDAEVK